MNYTNEQYEIIRKMVNEFSLVDNHKIRKEKLSWYDLASGIKNIDITTKIMKDLNAI